MMGQTTNQTTSTGGVYRDFWLPSTVSQRLFFNKLTPQNFGPKLPPPRKSRNVVAVNSPSLSLDELR